MQKNTLITATAINVQSLLFKNKFEASKKFFQFVANLYIYRDRPINIFNNNPRIYLCLNNLDYDDIAQITRQAYVRVSQSNS